jgi:hypothetical protein
MSDFFVLIIMVSAVFLCGVLLGDKFGNRQ